MIKDLLDQPDRRDLVEILDHLVRQDLLVLLVKRVQLDQLVRKGSRAIADHKGAKVQMDRLDLRAHPATLVPKVHLERLGHQVKQDLKDLLVQLELQGQLVLLGQPDPLDQPVIKVPQVQPDLEVSLEVLGLLEIQDLRVPQEVQALQDQQVMLVPKETKASKDQGGSEDSQVKPDQLVQLATRDLPVQLETSDQLDHWGPRVRKVLQDSQPKVVLLVQWAALEALGQLDRQVHRVQPERKDRQGSQGQQVYQDPQARLETAVSLEQLGQVDLQVLWVP